MTAFFFGNKGFRSLILNYRELKRLKVEIELLQKEEDHIRDELDKMRNRDFHLERMARKELGYMKPGELEYRFSTSK